MGCGIAGSTKLTSIYTFGRNLCSGFLSGDSPDAVASDGGSVEIMYSFVAGLLPKANHKRPTPGPFI